MSDAAIPANAVADEDDLIAPTTALLQSLNLLPSAADRAAAGEFAAAFKGPPDSVAIIEAGATAFSKVWAAGLGAAAVGVWSATAKFYSDQPEAVRPTILIGAAVVSAALILALAYVIGSDVRGRAAAMVATVNARSAVSRTLVQAAGSVWTPQSPGAAPISLPAALSVKNLRRPASDETGWAAILVRNAHDADSREYFVVKGDQQEWLAAEHMSFQ